MMTTMDDRTGELVNALSVAFPGEPISAEWIDEPSANWSVYEDVGELQSLVGTSWVDVSLDFLTRHPTLPIYAGVRLFHAMLPAYLRRVLLVQTRLDELPFQLASQLTRSDDPGRQGKFDRRAAIFTPAQCAVVHDVLLELSTRLAIDEPMARALPTWKHLLERHHED